jgi:hypothetical protein
VRARRVLHLFEHFAGILPISSVVPRDTLLRWMLPDMPDAFRRRWVERHGDRTSYFGDGAASAPPEAPAAKASSLAGLTVGSAVGGWRITDLVVTDGGAAHVVVLARPGGGVSALRIEPRDESRPAFVRTRTSNLSYLREWAGNPCEPAPAIVPHIAELLDAAS